MDERFLIIESAHRLGWVALAQGDRVIGSRVLEESRRHARDLAPRVRELLSEQGWRAAQLTGVIVSRGPGSYTGLRVGLMSAKTLAYATGAALLGVDTFAAIAMQAPREAAVVDVIADAQQGKIYVQRFADGKPGELAIKPVASWFESLPPGTCVTGPGLELVHLPGQTFQAPSESRLPRVESALALGLGRFRRGERDDPFALEPIYLRPSSAEEKWQRG